jgi:hypothetical protein
MVELDFPFPSHVNSSTLMLSRINRIFLGLPKSSLPLVKICSGVKKDPTWFEGCGLSDHAPVFFKVDTSMKKPPTQLRIHPEWCQHESFHRRLLALNNCISWDTYSLDEQSALLKENQRDAAIFARDCIFIENPEAHATIMTRLSSIARAVWSNDKHLFVIFCYMKKTYLLF